MSRALTAEWVRVLPDEEPAAAQQWRARRHRLAAEGCHHWIFRNPADPTAFLEFIEAADGDLLAGARSRAGMPAAPILLEVELS